MSNKLTAADFALYLGCQCFDVFNDCYINMTPRMLSSYAENDGIDQLKPVLRQIKDMTNEEIKEWERHHLGRSAVYAKGISRQASYLFKIRIDVFDWIKQGLALDASEIKFRTCRECGCTDRDGESFYWREDDLCYPCEIQEGP